jgi:hypothetical protein
VTRRGAIHHALPAETIGILAQIFGAGRSIRVPTSTAHPAAKRFEVLIGIGDTAALIRAFGGCTVYLPGLPAPDGKPRPPTLRQVRRLSKTMSARKIADRFGCSVRSIYLKRKRLRDQTTKGQ